MTLYFYISAALAFFATTALILSFRPIARALGLVDVPNERKVHEGEVPLIGGIAIFVAVVATHVISQWFFPGPGSIRHYTSFYVAGALLVLVGVVDDFREVSPRLRLLVEAVAVLVIIAGANVVVRDLGTIGIGGQSVALGVLAVPFTIFAVVGVINAVNMSDGMDGLAGTLSLVPILGFIAATVFLGDGKDLVILWCFAASIIAFLLFNVTVPGRRRALIFLGDSGSMFLGMALAWFAIRLSQGEHAPLSPAAALWFLTLPIFDTTCTTIRRLLRGRSLFSPDKEHLHHVFLLAGFTVTETVLIMSGLAAVGVMVGLAGSWLHISDDILAGGFVILGLMYFGVIMRAWTFMRFLRRSICRRREIVDRRTVGERRRSGRGPWAGPERRLQERRLGERRAPQRVVRTVSDSSPP
ncbi:MAG TPA: MraY family glycosyltransferase [Woeseiaceae bacterium]|nr:MraY family glycosyltransferase [Woeseiaceae bacterium]